MPAVVLPLPTLDEPVSFTLDLDAEPGDVLPALARLLIGIDRHQRERQAGDQAAGGNQG